VECVTQKFRLSRYLFPLCISLLCDHDINTCVLTSRFCFKKEIAWFVHVRKSQIQGFVKDIQGHVSANSRTNTEEKGLEISKVWCSIFQNATLMSFKQLCHIWTCKINSTKCPFWMSNNFRKYPKTKAKKM
jgi:hypothetical protein